MKTSQESQEFFFALRRNLFYSGIVSQFHVSTEKKSKSSRNFTQSLMSRMNGAIVFKETSALVVTDDGD